MECTNCGEALYQQEWMGDDGPEYDWTHEWSGDVLCHPDLRRLSLTDDEFHRAFEASDLAALVSS